jgi:predicted Zn-dependent peptidase
MLFKGTTSRSARDIAQTIDGIGGQLDAFTAKEYASYYIKILDEHLPVAIDLLSDMVMRPALARRHRQRAERDSRRHLRMVDHLDERGEDFAQQFWSRHPLGRPILGTPETVGSFSAKGLREYFSRTYVAPHIVIAAAGNLEHEKLRDLIGRAFEELPALAALAETAPPAVSPASRIVRRKSSRAISAWARLPIIRRTTIGTRSTC